MIQVSIVEDNDAIRNGLAMLINATADMECISTYTDCETCIGDLPDHGPDVILMDIGLPGMSGIEGVREIKKDFPDIHILMLTVYEENDKIFDALCAGATGYLVKKTPAEQLIQAIQDVVHGGSPMSSHIARKVVAFFQKQPPKAMEEHHLSSREMDILTSLANGNSYKLIADDLTISIDTVRFHIRNIYKKLQVNSQTEAISKAFRDGLIK
ncbi:response regulator transcription factor [bacterium]|nr:response regulator transcription factor [bacterium]